MSLINYCRHFASGWRRIPWLHGSQDSSCDWLCSKFKEPQRLGCHWGLEGCRQNFGWSRRYFGEGRCSDWSCLERRKDRPTNETWIQGSSAILNKVQLLTWAGMASQTFDQSTWGQNIRYTGTPGLAISSQQCNILHMSEAGISVRISMVFTLNKMTKDMNSTTVRRPSMLDNYHHSTYDYHI